MIVVADTSPLNYLIQINCDSLLPKIYQQVFIPPAVLQELKHPRAPQSVKLWLRHLPSWLEIHSLRMPPDNTLTFLDPGEREAIQLATEQHADLLLIDERRGRTEAAHRGLATTGTLGVLLAADKLGLIDRKLMYGKLITETSFRTTSDLESKFLQ